MPRNYDSEWDYRNGRFQTPLTVVERIASLFDSWNDEGQEREGRIYDPFAGNGVAIDFLGRSLNMTAYGIEESADRANQMIDLLGPVRGVKDSFNSMTITKRAFQLGYFYPGFDRYDHENTIYPNIRQSSLRWLDDNAYLVIIIDRSNVSKEFTRWLWRHSAMIDVYHAFDAFGYQAMLIVAQKGLYPRKIDQMRDFTDFIGYFENWMRQDINRARYEAAMERGDTEFEMLDPRTVTFGYAKLGDALFKYIEQCNSIPDLPDLRNSETKPYGWDYDSYICRPTINFRPRQISPEIIVAVAEENGAHLSQEFTDFIQPRGHVMNLQLPTLPRPKQAGAVVASGALGSTIILSDGQNNRQIVRSNIRRVTRVVNTQEYEHEETGDVAKIETRYQEAPLTRITTIDEQGGLTNLTDDDALTGFMQEHGPTLMRYIENTFPPLYRANPEGEQFIELDAKYGHLKVRGEYAFNITQKHVINTIYTTLKHQQGAILVGEMGTGKTIMTVIVAHLMRQFALECGYSVRKMRRLGNNVIKPGEIVLIMAPPTVAGDKWREEFEESIPNVNVVELHSYDDVKRLKKAADQSLDTWNTIKQGDTEPTDEQLSIISRLHIGLLPESVAKTDEGWEHAVHWKRNVTRRYGQPEYVPIDPVTGQVLNKIVDNELVPLTTGDISNKANGQPAGNQRWSGIPATPPPRDKKHERFVGGDEELEEAELAHDARVEEWYTSIENGVFTEDEMPLDRYTGNINSHTRYVTVYGRDNHVYHNYHVRLQRNAMMVAMSKIRQRRQKYDKKHPDHYPVWQQSRRRSSIKHLTGKSPAEVLEFHLNQEREEAGKEPRQCGHLPMPLPDVMRDRLFQEKYWLLGAHDDWQEGKPMWLADYIIKVFGKRIALAVFDELHQYKSPERKRAQVFLKLTAVARKSLGLTGTVFGGKASTVFLLLWAFNEEVRRLYPDPMSSATQSQWYHDMGVSEYKLTRTFINPDGSSAGGQECKTSEKEVPGANPALLKYLLNCAVFVNMLDMEFSDEEGDLPPYTQIPVSIPMNLEERDLYTAADDFMTDYMQRANQIGDYSFGAAYFQSLLGLPTAIYRDREVWHRRTITQGKWEQIQELQETEDQNSDEIWHPCPDNDQPNDARRIKVQKRVITIPGMGEDYISSKEQWLIRLVNGELAAGRGVGVYLSQTGDYDIAPRVEKLLKDNCPLAKPFIVRPSVSAKTREKHIAKQASRGKNVLICNAKLVSEGVNLLDFPTLVAYEVHYSLYVMVQSSHRNWRMNQERPCRVYYPHMVKTGDVEALQRLTPVMEHRAIRMIGQKERAMALLSGESLGALTQLEDGNESSLQDGVIRAILENDTFRYDTEDVFSQITSGRSEDNVPTYMEGIEIETEYQPRLIRENLISEEELLNELEPGEFAEFAELEEDVAIDELISDVQEFLYEEAQPSNLTDEESQDRTETPPGYSRWHDIVYPDEYHGDFVALVNALDSDLELVDVYLEGSNNTSGIATDWYYVEDAQEPPWGVLLEADSIQWVRDMYTRFADDRERLIGVLANLETPAEDYLIQWDFQAEWADFISQFEPQLRQQVQIAMQRNGNYDGVIVMRRFFVQRSAMGLVKWQRRDDNYYIGRFLATVTEVKYLEHLYSKLPIERIRAGELTPVTRWNLAQLGHRGLLVAR